MATDHQAAKLTHEERTADALRDQSSHVVTLTRISQINATIRLLHLAPVDKSRPINFLPGQWLDVFVPGISKAGGFTITSAPASGNVNSMPAEPSQQLELAVQKSPKNPPAAWLWRPDNEIIGANLTVRVGGDFIWSPRLEGKPGADEWNQTPPEQRSVLMVAGGVGINPIMSMLSHMHHERTPLRSLTLLYATKAAAQPDGSDILFLSRIKAMAAGPGGDPGRSNLNVRLFITPSAQQVQVGQRDGVNADERFPLDNAKVALPLQQRRIEAHDLELALPEPGARGSTVCYICGPRAFTDGFVEALTGFKGMHSDRVLCERWW